MLTFSFLEGKKETLKDESVIADENKGKISVNYGTSSTTIQFVNV